MIEAEVQSALVSWFRQQGYSVMEQSQTGGGAEVDLIATSPRDEWRVEVKGDYDKQSSQYTVNCDTGMGQVLKAVTRLDDRTKYGIGLPISRTERRERLSYRSILPKYARSIAFEVLNIHLLLVRDDCSVEVVAPTQACTFLSQMGLTRVAPGGRRCDHERPLVNAGR